MRGAPPRAALTRLARIVAQVKTGKSTLWNAILNRDLFPSAATACTSRLTVVKYAPVPYVKLTPPAGGIDPTLAPKISAFEDLMGIKLGARRTPPLSSPPVPWRWKASFGVPWV